MSFPFYLAWVLSSSLVLALWMVVWGSDRTLGLVGVAIASVLIGFVITIMLPGLTLAYIPPLFDKLWGARGRR